MTEYEYTVIYEKSTDSWSAYVPDLPGCTSTADNFDGIKESILEAMAFHIEGLVRHGYPVPAPTSVAGQAHVLV